MTPMGKGVQACAEQAQSHRHLAVTEWDCARGHVVQPRKPKGDGSAAVEAFIRSYDPVTVRGRMETEHFYETGPHAISSSGAEMLLNANAGRGPYVEFGAVAAALKRMGAPRWPPEDVVGVRRTHEGLFYVYPKQIWPPGSFDPHDEPGPMPMLGKSKGKGHGTSLRVFYGPGPMHLQQGEPLPQPAGEPSAPCLHGGPCWYWDDRNPWEASSLK